SGKISEQWMRFLLRGNRNEGGRTTKNLSRISKNPVLQVVLRTKNRRKLPVIDTNFQLMLSFCNRYRVNEIDLSFHISRNPTDVESGSSSERQRENRPGSIGRCKRWKEQIVIWDDSSPKTIENVITMTYGSAIIST